MLVSLYGQPKGWSLAWLAGSTTLAPVTIRFKVLMQELRKNKLGWDQPLDGDLLSKWITLPRCCLQGPRSKVQGVSRNCIDYSDSVMPQSLLMQLLCTRGRRPCIPFLCCIEDSSVPVETCDHTNVTIPRLELLFAVSCMLG